MVLSGTTISSRGLIVGAIESSFRDGSYDLTIKDFVTPDGKIVEEFVLPAQGIVKVISAEEVKVPADVIGYVRANGTARLRCSDRTPPVGAQCSTFQRPTSTSRTLMLISPAR